MTEDRLSQMLAVIGDLELERRRLMAQVAELSARVKELEPQPDTPSTNGAQNSAVFNSR
jgi:hypothetical protein